VRHSLLFLHAKATDLLRHIYLHSLASQIFMLQTAADDRRLPAAIGGDGFAEPLTVEPREIGGFLTAVVLRVATCCDKKQHRKKHRNHSPHPINKLNDRQLSGKVF